MQHTHYTIGVITNLDGQSMQDLTKMASQYDIVFEKILCSHIPLTGFAESDFVKKVCSYDIVYYRTGLRDTILDELSYILKKKNVLLINGSGTHRSLHKKIQQALLADRFGIAHPKSLTSDTFDYESVATVLGKTFVIKPDIGSKGLGVQLISSQAELSEVKAKKKRVKYIYQELIEGWSEYRVYTVGPRGIASYKKAPGENDFRANLHAGGSMSPTEPEKVASLLAFGGYVAECFDADIAGVDILEKDGEHMLLELNFQPGWESLDEVAGTDFSKETIRYIQNRAHEHHEGR